MALVNFLGKDLVGKFESTKKNIHDLLNEINHGESFLVKENGEIIRCLSVIKMVVLNGEEDGVQLREVKKILPGGASKEKNAAPSEKLKGGEGLITSCKRGLKEEMGLVEGDYEIMNMDTPKYLADPAKSGSYPLNCRYDLYFYSICVFKPEKVALMNKEDDGTITHFEWQEYDEIGERFSGIDDGETM